MWVECENVAHVLGECLAHTCSGKSFLDNSYLERDIVWRF